MKKLLLWMVAISPMATFAQINDSTQRQVKLQGAVNVRDLGGYATKSGKAVKWGKIYRSAEINNLTPTDLDTLRNRKIDYVLDFRGPAEFTTAPDKLPVGATRISLPSGSEDVGDRGKMMQSMMKATTGDSIMLPFYANIAPFTNRYKPMFETLLHHAKDSAVLFHCTAGKDRTGIAAALILYALGVDEQTIMNDYLASNYYRQRDSERMKTLLVNTYHMKESVVNDVMGVNEKYLNATFTAIKAQYGSVDNYLKKEMGLGTKEIKQLREAYLN
ncbi:tyrosine-protein phosphatase [Parasediminibacterium paludis]|uniref:Tyrosine-protein phosphatase n=1 Tax=Parasediminibacterium paludis TaxID=908966 RepID=A0ABV8PXF8_9BACT